MINASVHCVPTSGPDERGVRSWLVQFRDRNDNDKVIREETFEATDAEMHRILEDMGAMIRDMGGEWLEKPQGSE